MRIPLKICNEIINYVIYGSTPPLNLLPGGTMSQTIPDEFCSLLYYSDILFPPLFFLAGVENWPVKILQLI